MEEIEDETDLREQIFHNNVREQIVSDFFVVICLLRAISLKKDAQQRTRNPKKLLFYLLSS